MSNAMRELKIEEIECVVGTHGGTSQGFAMGVGIGACLGFRKRPDWGDCRRGEWRHAWRDDGALYFLNSN